MKSAKTTVRYDDFLIEQLKKDPRFLEAYLNEALSDETEDPRVILDMLRHVADASGGLTRLAKATKLNRQSLYRTLSSKHGNPEFFTVNRIIRGFGYHFKIEKDRKVAVGAK